MRNFAWVVLAFSCAALVRADEVQIFTPSNPGDAPIFMNGQLVRIDRAAGTITLRTDRGQSVLHVDRQTMARMGSLRAGSNVIVGLSGSGTNVAAERRTVIDVRPTVASSLGRGRVSASASGGAVTITPSKTSAMGTSSSANVPAARGGEVSTM